MTGGVDAKDYYRYFLDRDEKFIIRVKKNRDIIYKNKPHNIMDVAKKYKENYCMGFTDKHGKKIQCRISYIPVKLCTFPQKDLVLVAVYGFGKKPMLLLTNLEIQKGSLFMDNVFECSKRIYKIPKFVFYAMGYAIRRVLAGTRSGIKGFILKKEQSQQLTLAQYFGTGAFG